MEGRYILVEDLTGLGLIFGEKIRKSSKAHL
jgi:hypothetical protein